MSTTTDYVPENEDMAELLATRTTWEERHEAWIRESVTRDRMLRYLKSRGSATIAELADVGGVSIERIVADMGGLHDYGIVTKYGNEPQSVVRWQIDA